MGTNDIKVPRDWKWILQIGVLITGITGGITANSNLSERVLTLELLNKQQVEQMHELKDTIKELRDELKARKIVNSVAVTPNHVAGETHISE